MKKLLCGLCAVLNLFVLAVPAGAVVGTPADVTLEAAGGAGPLLPQLAVRTTTTPVVKDGDPAHGCSGTSAAGALEVATAGDWTADHFAGLGYAVTALKGELHRFPSSGDPSGDGNYWGFYVNGRYQNAGLCDTELQTGDSVQLYPICSSTTTGCYSGEPLQLAAPATAAPGAPFTVRVTESDTTYDSNYVGTSTVAPSAGASVGAASTGADGRATVTLSARGPQTLTAAKSPRAPSSATVCVTDGADGFCGTTVPGAAPAGPAAPAPAACVTTGRDGRCGTTDQTPAAGVIQSVREQQRFARGKGPRALGGSAGSDPSGIQDVSIRLTRSVGARYYGYAARSERFVRLKRFGAAGGSFFSVGDRQDWSYLLPSRLGPGRYVLDVRVTDRAGNVDSRLARGRSRIVFIVR